MKQIKMTVGQAKALLDTLYGALEPLSLNGCIMTLDASDRELRSFAEVVRETVLEFEARRIEAGRKSKTAAPTEPGA